MKVKAIPGFIVFVVVLIGYAIYDEIDRNGKKETVVTIHDAEQSVTCFSPFLTRKRSWTCWPDSLLNNNRR